MAEGRDFFAELEAREKAEAAERKASRQGKNEQDENRISVIHKYLAALAVIVAVAVFLIGCVVYPISNSGGNGEVVGACWVAVLSLLGASLIGFTISEVVQILHDIRTKLYADKSGKKK